MDLQTPSKISTENLEFLPHFVGIPLEVVTSMVVVAGGDDDDIRVVVGGVVRQPVVQGVDGMAGGGLSGVFGVRRW